MIALLFQFLALSLGAQAVTIILHGTTDCMAELYRCSNIAQGTCCINPSTGGTFAAALFQGLPLPAAQGIVYPTDRMGAKGCTDTNSCNAGYGTDLCLSCSTSLVGANWINPTSKRDVEYHPEQCEMPDMVTFPNGRRFDIFHDVPQNVSMALVTLREEDPNLDGGVPEYLLRYERAE